MVRRVLRKGRISTPTGVTMTAACFRQRLPAARQRAAGTSAAACMAHRGAGKYGVIVSYPVSWRKAAVAARRNPAAVRMAPDRFRVKRSSRFRTGMCRMSSTPRPA